MLSKKNLKYLLIGLIITSILWPGDWMSAAAPKIAQPAAKLSKTGDLRPVLSVSSAPLPVSLAANGGSGFCSITANTTTNLVQDTGLINWNQASDCWTIQNIKLSLPAALSVRALPAPGQLSVVVVTQPLRVWKHFAASSNSEQHLPALPGVAVGLTTIIVVEWQRAKRLVAKHLSPMVKVLTLSQLQIRRC